MAEAKEMDGKPAVPDGVTVIVLLDNHAMGTESDFDRSGYGGFTLRESQERRARHGAWTGAIRSCCHPHVADALVGAVRTQEISQLLRAQSGWREHVIVHGHGGEDE